jgi:hypothetical protein
MIHLIENPKGDWRQLNQRDGAIIQDIAALARQDGGSRHLVGIQEPACTKSEDTPRARAV